MGVLDERAPLSRFLPDGQQGDTRLLHPQMITREHGAHPAKLHQPLGVALRVGASVQQHGRGGPWCRKKRGDRRPGHPPDPPHP